MVLRARNYKMVTIYRKPIALNKSMLGFFMNTNFFNKIVEKKPTHEGLSNIDIVI